MEKALEILKHYHNLCSQLFLSSGDEEYRDEYVKINEAIAELEENMKPKTCYGCRYGAFGVNGLGFEVECRIGYNCSRGREDRYEPKDNA